MGLGSFVSNIGGAVSNVVGAVGGSGAGKITDQYLKPITGGTGTVFNGLENLGKGQLGTGLGQILGGTGGAVAGFFGGGLLDQYLLNNQLYGKDGKNGLFQYNSGVSPGGAVPGAGPEKQLGPNYPGYESYLNAQNKLPSQFQLQPNNRAIESIRSQALASGPTAWAQGQVSQLDKLFPGQASQIHKQLGGARTMAKEALKSEGGLTGANSKRLDQQYLRDRMFGVQNQFQQKELQKQNILQNDAQLKQQMLEALPGLEQQALAPQQFNIEKTIEEKIKRDYADLERYKTQMQGWATANTSQAMANSGKK